MRTTRAVWAALVMAVGATGVASAQPTAVVSSSTVAPGTPVTVTVQGTPGHRVAIIGSTVGSGFSFGGVALSVGPDVAILAVGVLDGGGGFAAAFTPPFTGTTLDRYYVQAVTSPVPTFAPLQQSARLVLRNADLVAAPPQIGSAAATFITLATADNVIMVTPPFVATSSATCLVTSSVQVDPNGGIPLVPAGTRFGFVQNAVSRNGVTSNDGTKGHYMVSNGATTPQPGLSRASVIAVAAGETVVFGVRVAGVSGNAINQRVDVLTSYGCW